MCTKTENRQFVKQIAAVKTAVFYACAGFVLSAFFFALLLLVWGVLFAPIVNIQVSSLVIVPALVLSVLLSVFLSTKMKKKKPQD
jgi:hypothetical protein